MLLEELGYACAAVPFLSTAVAAAVIDRFGSDEDRERWLPGLVAGQVTAGLGPVGLTVDGDTAALAISRHPGGGTWLAVDIVTEPLVAIDPTRRFGTIGQATNRELPDGAGALVTTAVAAELVGVCQRALEMSLEYVKERRQFGVPVGSFQAVAHRCAQMLLHTESVRSTAYYAAWAADAGVGGSVSVDEAAALAGAAAATAGREVTASAIQAHGGVGFTWEADVHWLFKRAEVDRALLGGATTHHVALARAAAARVAGQAV